jgi:hypothetical protein
VTAILDIGYFDQIQKLRSMLRIKQRFKYFPDRLAMTVILEWHLTQNIFSKRKYNDHTCTVRFIYLLNDKN